MKKREFTFKSDVFAALAFIDDKVPFLVHSVHF